MEDTSYTNHQIKELKEWLNKLYEPGEVHIPDSTVVKIRRLITTVESLKGLERLVKSDSTWQIMFNANDVFAWACADAQTIDITQSLDDVIHIHEKYGYEGLLALMSHVRDSDPQKPIWKHHEKKKYKDARKEIASLAIQGADKQIEHCKGLSKFRDELIHEYFGFQDWGEAKLGEANDKITVLENEIANLREKMREMG